MTRTKPVVYRMPLERLTSSSPLSAWAICWAEVAKTWVNALPPQTFRPPREGPQ